MSNKNSVHKLAQKSSQDGSQKQILDKIRNYQKEIGEFRNKCDKEIFEVEKRYVKVVAPFLQERNALIKRVPRFWSKVVLNHPLLTTVFEPGEKDVFKHLAALDIEDMEDNPDFFRVHFHFDTNPYFENRVLTKQFTEEGSASTTIKWKSNQSFPKAADHEVWEFDELGLEMKGFFRWFSDPEEQFCDPIADILRCHVWYDPLEFYFEDPLESLKKDSAKVPPPR